MPYIFITDIKYFYPGTMAEWLALLLCTWEIPVSAWRPVIMMTFLMAFLSPFKEMPG
jgi:hypothetical protein